MVPVYSWVYQLLTVRKLNGNNILHFTAHFELVEKFYSTYIEIIGPCIRFSKMKCYEKTLAVLVNQLEAFDSKCWNEACRVEFCFFHKITVISVILYAASWTKSCIMSVDPRFLQPWTWYKCYKTGLHYNAE